MSVKLRATAGEGVQLLLGKIQRQFLANEVRFDGAEKVVIALKNDGEFNEMIKGHTKQCAAFVDLDSGGSETDMEVTGLELLYQGI